MQKASRSLEVYNMNCVIGNLLETRYTQVLVVTKKVRKTLISPPKGEMLESMIISEIVSLHMAFEKETR